MALLVKRLLAFFLAFALTEAAVRLMIGWHEMANLDHGMRSLAADMAVGLMMDVAAFCYVLPVVLLLLFAVSGRRGARLHPLLFAAFLAAIVCVAVGQWLFWDELTSRFNFIAVDYLIYMDEVTGNIRESYPLPLLISAVLMMAAAGGFLYARLLPVRRVAALSRRQKLAMMAVALVLAAGSFLLVSEESGERFTNRYDNEIAKNGLFSLFSAFRHNELSYTDLYLTQPPQQALAQLREQLASDGYAFADDGITRHITAQGKEIHPNIVLITVESLSADYMGIFGNRDGLTPNLDRIAAESMLFTNLYATGTRTVYGLSAITLSMPPVPGNAVARRPDNGGLFSLGSVLKHKGYDSRFMYGGFGYFDNMNTFFGGNDYRIIDRSDLRDDEIRFANIWGVCDEDLYQRSLRENDASYAAGQPFFDMLMTTSNHQPFTYPGGKVAIPSGTGRYGGIQYTDYAIGQFLEEAKSHPWFDNTIFVIVADHTAGSSGKMELTPQKHHIPMMFYAPKLIQPQVVDQLASQIDLAPTLLGLLNMRYDSRFYGRDLLKGGEPRAFIANYQRIGLLKPDALSILKPGRQASVYRHMPDGSYQPQPDAPALQVEEAVAWFQNASRWRELSRAIPGVFLKH
jgi:phosphoglycerol transferase MdoB-like AlkP superfamily enzyme